MSDTKKKRNRYDCKVYLGKELYQDLTQQADTMGLSLSSYLRVMITMGVEFGKTLERSITNGATRR